MAKIKINKDACKGCLLCAGACPKGLIAADQALNRKGYTPVVFRDDGSCVGCALCAIMCPDCCIEVYK